MTDSQASLHRVGGNLALDFANTVSWRQTAREKDHLATLAGLAVWAIGTGLIAPDEAALLAPAALAHAHRLRAAIRAAVEAAIAGNDAAPARADLVDLLRQSLASARLVGDPAEVAYDRPQDRIIGPVALAAVDLLRGPDLDRLKMCPQDDCHWLFLDQTRNRSRRWCDMAACGNRAKVARHRKATPAPAG